MGSRGDRYSAKTKAEVALRACREDKTVSELSSEYGVSGAQINRWKKTLIDRASELFDSSKAMDIFGAIISNGAIIQQYDYNDSGAQKFELEKTDYDHTLDSKQIDYSVSNYYPSPVQVAQSQIGTAIGTKYWTSYFGTRFISGSATPWCGCFVSWIFNHAGQGYKLNGIRNKASVGYYYSYANATGRWTNTPVSGDIVVFGNMQHVGIVEKVIDGYVYTIEGNTGSTYNGEVKRHGFRRDDKWISGFIHLP